MESLALNVVGQDQSDEEISIFLEDWELARVALRSVTGVWAERVCQHSSFSNFVVVWTPCASLE